MGCSLELEACGRSGERAFVFLIPEAPPSWARTAPTVPVTPALALRSVLHLPPPDATRRRALALVSQAYTSIVADDFAAFVGLPVEEAVKGTCPCSVPTRRARMDTWAAGSQYRLRSWARDGLRNRVHRESGGRQLVQGLPRAPFLCSSRLCSCKPVATARLGRPGWSSLSVFHLRLGQAADAAPSPRCLRHPHLVVSLACDCPAAAPSTCPLAHTPWCLLGASSPYSYSSRAYLVHVRDRLTCHSATFCPLNLDGRCYLRCSPFLRGLPGRAQLPCRLYAPCTPWDRALQPPRF